MLLGRVPYLNSGSCKWLGGVRGREKRQFDQKEGRKDQPALTAASMLIKISLCTQLASASGVDAGSVQILKQNPGNGAVWSGGKWLSAFFRWFGKARAVSQGAVDAWVLSQHLRGSASCFCPCFLAGAKQLPADFALLWVNLLFFPGGRLPDSFPLTHRVSVSQWSQ